MRAFLAGYEDTCLDIVFEWGTAGYEDLKVTRGVGHFDGTVTWSVAAIVLDSYPYLSIIHHRIDKVASRFTFSK